MKNESLNTSVFNIMGNRLTILCGFVLLLFIGDSEAAPVQNGQAWRSVNYAIATLLEFHMDLYDAIADSKCPADLTGTSRKCILEASRKPHQTGSPFSFAI